MHRTENPSCLLAKQFAIFIPQLHRVRYLPLGAVDSVDVQKQA